MDSATDSAIGSLVREGPCGGCDGEPKDMYTNRNMNGVTRIVKIVIHYGGTVDSVEIFYVKNGKEESTGKWGGPGGRSFVINLGQHEYLTSIKGYIGKWEGQTVVRSLTFVSNQQSYGPFGPEEKMAFELPAVIGKILGFHGNARDFLNAIGTYVKP